MYIYETHLHTNQVSKCGKATGEEMVRAYQDKGYAGIFVTEHFFNGNCAVEADLSWKDKVRAYMRGYEMALEAGVKNNFPVFFGFESSTYGRDLLVYGLGEEFLLAHEGIEKMEAEEFCTTCMQAGGFVVHAHPYRQAAYITKIRGYLRGYYEAVEFYNSGNGEGRHDAFNQDAIEKAEGYDFLYFSGADAHRVEAAGHAGMGFEKKIRDVNDFISLVRAGKGHPICGPEAFLKAVKEQ